jgi:hypothetical protein
VVRNSSVYLCIIIIILYDVRLQSSTSLYIFDNFPIAISYIIESRPCIMINDWQLIIKRQYNNNSIWHLRHALKTHTWGDLFDEIRHVQTTNNRVVTAGYRTKLFFLKYWSRPRRRSVQYVESRSLRIIRFIISPSCAVFFFLNAATSHREL